MPGDCLSLTVRVRREKDLTCLFSLGTKLLDNVTLASDIYIMRLKAVLYVNSESALGQISYMSLGGNNLVVRTKISFNCVSLGRRLYYY